MPAPVDQSSFAETEPTYRPPQPFPENPPLMDQRTAEMLYRFIAFDMSIEKVDQAVQRMDAAWTTATKNL